MPILQVCNFCCGFVHCVAAITPSLEQTDHPAVHDQRAEEMTVSLVELIVTDEKY